MTELTITFDGQDLTLSRDGNEIARFDAYSGHGAYQAPQFQDYADHGPIPEGSYSFTLNDIQQPRAIDIFLSPFGMGAWPAWGGNEVGWGTMRAPLTPSEGTETYGRSGFFIHGGQNPGSAGCIDVTTNDIALFSFIKVYEDSDGIIPVIVSYSPPIQSNSLDAAINAAHPFYEDAIVRMAGGGSGDGSGGSESSNDDDDTGSVYGTGDDEYGPDGYTPDDWYDDTGITNGASFGDGDIRNDGAWRAGKQCTDVRECCEHQEATRFSFHALGDVADVGSGISNGDCP